MNTDQEKIAELEAKIRSFEFADRLNPRDIMFAHIDRLTKDLEEARIEIKQLKTKSIGQIQTEIHDNAIDHGWHLCSMCGGNGEVRLKPIDPRHADLGAIDVTCPQCDGERKHRHAPEAIALIMAEGAEALEALRDPDSDHLCDKCGGIGQVSVKTQAGDREIACEKCNGTGIAICGSRYVEELADIVIRTLDESGRVGANLARAIELKIAYNKTRPYRHGKKF